MIKLNLPDIDSSSFDREWRAGCEETHTLPICPLVRQWVLRVLACMDGVALQEIEEHRSSMTGMLAVTLPRFHVHQSIRP